MKLSKTIIAFVLSLSATSAHAETYSFGQTFALTEPVGTLFTFNIQSNNTSYFSGRFQSSFNYIQNVDNPFGTTTFNRNFNFSGNSNFNITNQVNTNTTQWTFNPW